MNTLARKYPIIFMISAFFPYLSIQLGLKVEHLVIYPFFYLALLTCFMKETKFFTYLTPILSLWICTFIFLTFRTLLDTDASMFEMLAEMENYAQPIAIMFVFIVLTRGSTMEQYKEKLLGMSKLLIFLLSLNTLWIVVGFIFDVQFINELFWRGTEATGFKAATMGRYSGIFNQPAEAGVAYTIGLIALVYVMDNAKEVTFRHNVPLILMAFGGIVTVSKIFLFGGIPLFFVAILMHKRIRRQIIKLIFWISVLSYLPYLYIRNNWDGFAYLMRYVDGSSQQGILELITAGRFGGENSQQSFLFSQVWNEHPILGSGFGKQIVVDSAFFQFFGSGGTIALILYIFIMLYILFISLQFLKRGNFNSESKFLWLIVLLVIGGGFGIPVFTSTRSSIIMWIFVCMLLQYYYLFNKSKEESAVVSKEPAIIRYAATSIK